MDKTELRIFRNTLNGYFKDSFDSPPVIKGINPENPKLIRVTLSNVPIDQEGLDVLKEKVRDNLGNRFSVELCHGSVELRWHRMSVLLILFRLFYGLLLLSVIGFCGYMAYYILPEVKEFMFAHEQPLRHYIYAAMYLFYITMFSSASSSSI